MATQYADWPTRSPGPPSDKLAEHRQKLIDGIRKEIAGRPRGRPWSRNKHCSLRVSAKKMPVDDEGHLAAIVDSDDEVKEWYEQQLLDVEEGKLDERIKEHLADSPPNDQMWACGKQERLAASIASRRPRHHMSLGRHIIVWGAY